MINAISLYKLLVGNIYPKCVNCKNFKAGIVTNGYCKIFGEILQARTDKELCGLKGNSFKKQTFVNEILK